MNVRVLLIKASIEIRGEFKAPEIWFPDGLLHIATLLKKNGIESKIVDFNSREFVGDSWRTVKTGEFPGPLNLNDEQINNYIDNKLLKLISEYAPHIIGIGCFSSEAFKNLKLVAMKIKKSFPNMPIAIGGIHPTIFGAEILKKYNFIDYVILGEGEITFFNLIRSLFEKNIALDSIDGIAFRYNGEVKYNPKTKFIDPLDELPFVDYSIIDLDNYKIDTSHWYSPGRIKITRPFSILSSRSCPERCNFCSMGLLTGHCIRFRTAKNVVDEIQNLYECYGANYFHFTDDNMTYSKERTLEISNEIIKRNLKIQFDTPNGLAIKRLDREMIDIMVEAGLIRISLAIESGSDYIRNRVIGKGLSREKIYEVVENCAAHKHLYIKLFFIVGMPEETHKSLQDTYKMITELPHDFPSIHFATPYPGTRLFNYCIKNNLLPHNPEEYMDYEEFHHDPEKPHFKPYNLSSEDLIEFRKRCYDYIEKIKNESKYPRNYPMRYEG